MRLPLSVAIAGLFVVLATWIGSSVLKYRFRSDETIVVTGLAEKDFSSDLVVWNGSYERKSLDLQAAYAQLKTDEATIREYLIHHGISPSTLVFSSVSIEKEFNTKEDENGRQVSRSFSGYNLTQTVSIESSEIEKIETISRQSTELIEKGIEFRSSEPSYYNTKLAEVKMELLAKASSDGKLRAQTIASNAGSHLGKLKKATMGVFQITGKNSNEAYSYGGAFNTSSKQKTGSITIRMEFAAD